MITRIVSACIEFKKEEDAKHFDRLHPGAKGALFALATDLAQQRLPHPLVTEIRRTPEEQRSLYGDVSRFSWHLVDCAWDIRIYNAQERRYTEDTAKTILDWLRNNFPTAELLMHEQAGTNGNQHIHFGWRAFERKGKYEDRLTDRTPPSD